MNKTKASNMTFANLQEIYMALGDELSRQIFEYRILYSISKDKEYIRKLVRTNSHINAVFEKIEGLKGDLVIYGAGEWGKTLIDLFPNIKWKCFLDARPQNDTVAGIPVISVDDFLSSYNNEWVIISSRKYRHEMEEKAYKGGIPKDKVISIGMLLESLMQSQYFDLECLPANQSGIFVDVGAMDAQTSVNYSNKFGVKNVVVFEPNIEMARICRENLSSHGINYEIIQKGAWSEEGKLNFTAEKKPHLSHISMEGNQTVEVTTLDKVLEGRETAFIKMDIEGSEYEALRGTEKTIQGRKPILAISVYHKIEDIYEIPMLILSFCKDYVLYLRHYNIWAAETVLYAIPRL